MKKYLAILLCFSGFLPAIGQPKSPDTVPLEKVVLHLNSNLLIAGEILQYSAYCLSQNGLSNLSKIGLIEIIDPEGESVSQSMFKLSEGRGNGIVRIPDQFQTGNYSVIAYTTWMKNFPIEEIFSTEVTIINPSSLSQQSTTLGTSHEPSTTLINSGPLELRLSEVEYGPRDMVSFQLESDMSTSVSISINLIDQIHDSHPEMVLPITVGSSDFEGVKFLPEIRGDIISGNLSMEDRPIQDVPVFITTAKQDFQFYASRTDANGDFFVTSEGITADEIFVSYEPQAADVTVTLTSDFLEDHSYFKPQPLELKPEIIEAARKRATYAAVQEAYSEFLPDKEMHINPKFYGTPDRFYLLDNYTRFVLMEEVIREYVGSVLLRKTENEFALKARYFDNRHRIFQENPLMLVDGIPFFTTSQIMAIDPKVIERIEVVGKRFFHGSADCPGIMSFQTYDGNLEGVEIPPYAYKLSYPGIERSTLKVRSDYSLDSIQDSRIPDYNTQLYWEPEKVIQGTEEFRFYTGDLEGTYEISILGISEDGEPIQILQTFVVKN